MTVDRLMFLTWLRARRRAGVRAGLGLLLVLAATAAPAQGTVTLYGGARAGGEFTDANQADAVIELDQGGAVSLSFDWTLADGREGQIFYSLQRSALPGSAFNRQGDVAVNVSYLHAGGRVFIDGAPAPSGAYVVGGLGISHFSPGLDGLSSEVRPSMNLGLGYQWALSRQVALRGEVRSYLTLLNSSGGFFCSGGCAFAIRGDLLTQFEGMLGLSIAF